MPSRMGPHIQALLFYVAVAAVFWWPLPAALTSALPGAPSSDTGVYIWNLWLFRHEILEHGHLPFATLEILNLDGVTAVPLVLHNYTTAANVIAFPLIGVLGLVATFNVLTMAAGVVAAYAMFLFAWRRTGDAGAALAGGLVFGFSPYLMARSVEHFSLAQAAPLPLFGLLMLRAFEQPKASTAALAGLTVAWAYLSDPYYAVYCLMIAAFMVGYSFVAVERRPEPMRAAWWPTVVNLALLCLGGLIVGVLLHGGGRVEFWGLRFSMRRLYTPVLLFTVLAIVRAWMALRPRIRLQRPFARPHVQAAFVAGGFCLLALAPVLASMRSPLAGRTWQGPAVWWRSSAPGMDLAAWFVPNPLHPLLGQVAADWIAHRPNGFYENVASIPWVVLGLLAAAWFLKGFRGTAGWWTFGALFGLMSLGPFIRIAGLDTYVPTPWALLRYLPIVGAARMPTRLTVLLMLAAAMLFAMALAHWRARSSRPTLVLGVVVTAVLFELLPAPRRLVTADVPAVFGTIAGDPRPLRLLNLPFGLKDGLGESGGFSTANQYFQTVHEKPMIGGYLSRLPDGAMKRYCDDTVLRVLIELSEDRAPDPALLAAAVDAGADFARETQLGYVVADLRRTPGPLLAFAEQAFGLTLIQSADGYALYLPSVTSAASTSPPAR